MASTMCMNQVVAPRTAAKQASASFTGLARVALPQAKAVKQPFVSNGSKTRAMLVWQPVNNKYFETLSYLPPLSKEDIAKQVDYITRNGWTPCLEFSDPEHAYVSNENCVRLGNVSANYVDNRYWTMFKLPMFGCTDSQQVLNEIDECTQSFPNAYIRIVAFDSVRQVQISMLLVHRPPNAGEYRPVEERSVGKF